MKNLRVWIKPLSKYLFISIVAAIIFALVLFPFDDLRDLVTQTVAKNSGIYLQFEKLGVSFLPTPSINLEKTYIETAQFPPLTIDSLSATPSFAAILKQKPFGTVEANGVFGGDISVSSSTGTRTETGVERQRFQIKAEKVRLEDLKDIANLPLPIKGRLNLQTDAQADLTFAEQPDADIVLSIDNFELPASSIETQVGPLNLPELRLQNVHLKGRLVGGKLNIEEGTIGKDNDEIRGSIKGGIGLSLQVRGPMVAPLVGAYNFDIDLQIKRSFESRAALFLSFLDSYKSQAGDGHRYAFKLSSSNPMMPPNMAPLSR